MFKKISSKAKAVLWEIAPLLAVIITLFIMAVVLYISAVGCVYNSSTKAKNPAIFYNEGDIVSFEYQVFASDEHNLLWVKHLGDDSLYIAEVSCDSFFELDFWSKALQTNKTLKEMSEIKIVRRIEKSYYERRDNCEIVE